MLSGCSAIIITLMELLHANNQIFKSSTAHFWCQGTSSLPIPHQQLGTLDDANLQSFRQYMLGLEEKIQLFKDWNRRWKNEFSGGGKKTLLAIKTGWLAALHWVRGLKNQMAPADLPPIMPGHTAGAGYQREDNRDAYEYVQTQRARQRRLGGKTAASRGLVGAPNYGPCSALLKNNNSLQSNAMQSGLAQSSSDFVSSRLAVVPIAFAHAKTVAACMLSSVLFSARLGVSRIFSRLGKEEHFAGVRGWSCQHDLAARTPAGRRLKYVLDRWSFTRSCCSFTLSQPAKGGKDSGGSGEMSSFDAGMCLFHLY